MFVISGKFGPAPASYGASRADSTSLSDGRIVERFVVARYDHSVKVSDPVVGCTIRGHIPGGHQRDPRVQILTEKERVAAHEHGASARFDREGHVMRGMAGCLDDADTRRRLDLLEPDRPIGPAPSRLIPQQLLD